MRSLDALTIQRTLIDSPGASIPQLALIGEALPVISQSSMAGKRSVKVKWRPPG